MSNYVFGTSLSYRDYLQARSFETSFKSEISKQTRSIIASAQELHAKHVSVLKEGVEQLSFDLQTLRNGVSELNATFEWGFSELLMALGGVNDTLAELKRIAKTPAQIWANEQFEIARDAYRQNLYDEALEYLDRAINGCQGHTGYKLDYRFHYLLGTIRMGSFEATSGNFVDLSEAENAFLSAAKYASHDHPKEAGLAFLAAGWTDYCQGKMPDAIRLTEQCLGLNPDLAEAHFQLAKIRMHVGDCDNALPSLKRAIELDRGYAIKAAGDDDFRRFDSKVCELIDALRQDARDKAETLLASTNRRVVETEERRVKYGALAKCAELGPVKSALEEAACAKSSATYHGYLNALSSCVQASQNLKKVISQFVAAVDAEVKKRVTDIESRVSANRHASMNGWWMVMACLGLLVSCILYNQRSDQDRAQQDPIARLALLLLYFVLPPALPFTIGLITTHRQKTKAITALEEEKYRLLQVHSEIQDWAKPTEQI